MKQILIAALLLIAHAHWAGAQDRFPLPEWSARKAAVMVWHDCPTSRTDDEGESREIMDYSLALSKVIALRLWLPETCFDLAREMFQPPAQVELHVLSGHGSMARWVRDYAPFWTVNRQTGMRELVAFTYSEGFEEQFPELIAREEGLRLTRYADLEADEFNGGNLLSDDDGVCFTALRTFSSKSAGAARREKLARLGCSRAVLLEAIPGNGSNHVDVFLMLFPGKAALMSHFERKLRGSHRVRQIMERNYRAVAQEGYRIVKVSVPSLLATYANAVAVNGHAFVPQYGVGNLDRAALTVFSALGYEVHPVMTKHLIRSFGSVHCVTNFIFQ